jgi:hypothetical protein
MANQRTLRIELSGLKLCARGRQSINSPKYEDDDWLSMTAQCRASGAEVRAARLIIHLQVIERWCDQISQMREKLSGSAILGDLEQQLVVELVSLDLGHVQLKVEITPDHLTQRHSFKFEIDQSYLGPVLAQCNALLAEYPIRGKRPVSR